MSKKRQLLIDTALDLFYKNGINSIGINEVLKVSGVAKRTLYTHFDSKEALVLAALTQRHQIFCTWLADQIADSNDDQQLIENLFKALERWFNSAEVALGDFRGCFFINTTAEFSDVNSEIARYCAQHKQTVRQIIQRQMHTDNPLLLDAICLLKEGAITTAYMTGQGKDVSAKSIQILNALRQESSK